MSIAVVLISPCLTRGGLEGGREDSSPWRSIGDPSWLGAAGGGGPMAAAAADAEERAERLVGLLPGGGGRPLFVDILQWELGLDQKRKVVVRGQERCLQIYCKPWTSALEGSHTLVQICVKNCQLQVDLCTRSTQH